MKHIVFVLGHFYPDPSPNGYCVQKIINELKRDYIISVICTNSSNLSSDLSKDMNIYYINNWRNKLRNFATRKYKVSKHKVLRKMYYSIIYLTRLFRGLLALYLWPTSEKWFINKAFKLLNDINAIKRIDTIVTVSIPYEAHISGLKFKKNNLNIKWLTYTLDRFSDNEALHKYALNKNALRKINIMSESEVHNLADMNFIIGNRRDWSESLPGVSNDKFRVLSFPLICPLEDLGKEIFNKKDDKIHLIFAGTFYKKIRNPEYLLKLFTNINSDKLVLHLFTRGDCEDIINKYVKISNGNIINHGIISIENIHTAMQQADILVNVGNTVTDQMPSKIYEYISSGKPIINFYSNNLSYNDIFKQYPFYLDIEQDFSRIQQKEREFLEFCLKNKGQKVDYKAIKNLYYESTPKYVSEIFEKYINE